MTGTRTYEAIDATFVLLVNDAQYRYMATSDGKPFSYFLNPAAYGGGVAKVRWNGTNWIFEDTQSTTAPSSLSYLDDRYTLGAGYGENNVPYGKNSTTVNPVQGYKAPLGTALPASEIVFNSSGELVIPGMTGVSLTPAYESAVIKPVLILKVYESRLASYEYYTYVGEYESGNGSDTNTASALFQLYADGNKVGLIDALLGQWVKRLKNNYATDTHLNYNLDNFYGSTNYTTWKNALTVTTVSSTDTSPGVNTVTVPSLNYVDGWNIKGEKAEEISSGHMSRPHVMIPGLTLVVGHEYFGLKNMRGVYTIFQRPEQLQYLAQVVKNTITTLIGTSTFETIGSLSDADEAKVVAALTEKLNVHWYDYFRGSESTVSIPVAWDGAGDPTAFKDVTVNVFMGINTQGNNLSGTVSYYVKGGTVESPTYTRVETTGMGVNLGDVFSYYDGEQDKSQPFPTAYGYVTGPYGSQVLIDNDSGKKIGYKSDAYTV
jgi:hypothetical protein